MDLGKYTLVDDNYYGVRLLTADSAYVLITRRIRISPGYGNALEFPNVIPGSVSAYGSWSFADNVMTFEPEIYSEVVDPLPSFQWHVQTTETGTIETQILPNNVRGRAWTWTFDG